MKFFDWNEEKNSRLKACRGVGFEDVVLAISENQLTAVIDHPNQKKYRGQKIFVIILNDYAYLVPFVEDAQKIFLKTIFPSRKYTREYVEKGGI